MLELVQTIRQFGFPKFIRTDNEVYFNSWWLKRCLRLLGIQKQTSQVACPWQNGLIERFFGRFKKKFKQLNVNHCHLQTELDIYRVCYNGVRTHSNLSGLTPAEVWRGKQNKNTEQAK